LKNVGSIFIDMKGASCLRREEVGVDLDSADARPIHDGEVGVALESPGRTPGVLNDVVLSLDRVHPIADSYN
jgi:hypothetical protein